AVEDEELRQEVAQRDQDDPRRDGPLAGHASRPRGARAPARPVRARVRGLVYSEGGFAPLRRSSHVTRRAPSCLPRGSVAPAKPALERLDACPSRPLSSSGSILVPIWIHLKARRYDGDADDQERARPPCPPPQGPGHPAPAESQPRGHRVPRGARAGGSGGPRNPAGARARGEAGARRWAAHGPHPEATQVHRARVIVVDTNLLVYLYVSGQNT